MPKTKEAPLQLDIFSLITEAVTLEESPPAQILASPKNEEESPREGKRVELHYLSYPISPFSWTTRFSGPEERAARYTDAVLSLQSIRKRMDDLIKESRERPRPPLAEAWRQIGDQLKALYCNYSGEGGIRLSVDLVRAQLNYVRERLPPVAQRRLILSGIRAVLSAPASPNVETLSESLRCDLDRLCSTDLSAAQVEHFLDRLSTLEKNAEGGLISRKGRKLNSEESHGAYYSPEVFQHLLRLLQISAINGREVNVLEPNIGKGSLIRPIAYHPGFLTLGLDLNPLSAEVAELTSLVDPNAAAQACLEGSPIPLGRRCGILRGHAFDLLDLVPNGLFDLLIANPPYVHDIPKKGAEKTFRGLGLSKLPEGFSLTAFTRQILPLKLREGGLSLLITSARARSFKRTRHATGQVSHPILILAVSGQPFADQDADLAPVSLSAYRFDGERITGKEHTEAQCFITLSVYLPAREAHGKHAAWSESEIVALDFRSLPQFVDLVLGPDRWTLVERQLFAPSVRMIRLANLLRLYTQIRENILQRLDLRHQKAKRSFRVADAERFRKMREEASAKRFQQIGSIGDLHAWVSELENKWDIPLQEEINVQLRKNPLRDLFSARPRVRSTVSEIEEVMRRAFDAILAVSDRFYSRFYILSAILPRTAQSELIMLYGSFNGSAFDARHPALRSVPYPFSLYLLTERELIALLHRFPEEERKAVISKIGQRRRRLKRSVPLFNELSQVAEIQLAEQLGAPWRQDLLEGVIPPVRKTQAATNSSNLLAREIGRLLHHLARQNPARLKSVNDALAPIDPCAAQERYDDYLRQFASVRISDRRIKNLIEKTEGLIKTLERTEEVLSGSEPAAKRKIRLSPGS